MPEIVIEITGQKQASEPNLPSHLFPGCSSGYGTFKIVSGEICKQLAEAAIEAKTIDPVQVNDCDPDGTGSFAVIDGEAPKPGTVIRFEYDDYPNW